MQHSCSARGTESAGKETAVGARLRGSRVLELCYYHRDLRTCADETEVEAELQKDKLRRRRGEAPVMNCLGDRCSTKVVIFWDRFDICTTFEQAVDHVLGLLLAMSFVILLVPSLIKWLSVWPVTADIVFGLSFHMLLRDGVRHAFAKDAAIDDARHHGDDLLSEGELLGAPLNESAFNIKQKRKRGAKSSRWVSDPSTYPFLLIYLIVAGLVMKLHFSLFKYAQQAPAGSEKSFLLNL